MDEENSNYRDEAENPTVAYTLAAGFVAALHYGLAPRTVTETLGDIRSDIPLFPDDLLREHPLHLAAARTSYSRGRVERMIDQGFWSIDVIVAPIVMAVMLELIGVSTSAPGYPRLSPQTLDTFLARCLTSIWPEDGVMPGGTGFVNSDTRLSAQTDFEQLVAGIALLTELNAPDLRALTRRRIESITNLLLDNWTVLQALAERIIRAGSLSEIEAVRIGATVLDAEFAKDPPFAGLMAFHRDQIRVRRLVAHAVDEMKPAFAPMFNEHMPPFEGADSLSEMIAAAPAELWTELAEGIKEHRLGSWVQSERAPTAVSLQTKSSTFKAGRLFLGLYNGGFTAWDSSWNFEEILPDRYSALPLECLENSRLHMSVEHRRRCFDQATWEIQGIFAGMAAEELAAARHEVADGRSVCFPEARLHCAIENSAALLRIKKLSHQNADQMAELIEDCWAHTCRVLDENWHHVEALKKLVDERVAPTRSEVLEVAGESLGARFVDDSVNALIFQQMRERIASDRMRDEDDLAFTQI